MAKATDVRTRADDEFIFTNLHIAFRADDDDEEDIEQALTDINWINGAQVEVTFLVGDRTYLKSNGIRVSSGEKIEERERERERKSKRERERERERKSK